MWCSLTQVGPVKAVVCAQSAQARACLVPYSDYARSSLASDLAFRYMPCKKNLLSVVVMRTSAPTHVPPSLSHETD